MNLKELKALVKEEYDRFLEQEDEKKDDAPKADAGDDKEKKDDKPKKPKAPKVKAGEDDLDLEENPEETLKAIYDMLKDFFEGDDKKDDAPKKDSADSPMGDMPEMPDAMGGSPMDMMMENKKSSSAKILQESLFKQRFKKLANIKK